MVRKGSFKRTSTEDTPTGKKFGLEPKIHADEFSNAGGCEVAAAVQAISADHLVYATDESIKKMKDAGVVGVLLPCVSFFLGKDTYAPYEKMKNIGLTVALGTDFNPGTSFCPSMSFVITLAVIKLKMTLEDAIIDCNYKRCKSD